MVKGITTFKGAPKLTSVTNVNIRHHLPIDNIHP